MKKVIAFLLVFVLALSFVACGNDETSDTSSAPVSESAASEAESEAESEEESKEEVVVMTHDEFLAADIDSKVVIETYVQAKQSHYVGNQNAGGKDTAVIYAQSEDGGYLLYDMPCTAEEYAALVPGTKIRVTGYKAEFNGEIEIAEAEFEILEGSFIAQPVDVTDKLGTDELVVFQNSLVAFLGMTVEASKDADGNDVAFLYKWNGSGSEGDDLYFNVSKDGKTYTFTVESYLCDKDSDVYKAVKALNVGDTIDLAGFLYWYEAAQPHIVGIAPSADAE